jgi:hypothetical protein
MADGWRKDRTFVFTFLVVRDFPLVASDVYNVI